MKQFKLDPNIKLSKTFKPKQIAYIVINTEGGVYQLRQVKQRGGGSLVNGKACYFSMLEEKGER